MSQPTRPCSVCGSVLFYKSNGQFKCAKHERPADMIGTQFYVTRGAEKFKDVIIKVEQERESVLDPSSDRPTKPCPLDGSVLFWRSNSTGLWTCARHNFPMDQADVAEAYNVETGELVTEEVVTTEKGDDMDVKRLVKALARQTGRTPAEVERALALTVAETRGEPAMKAAEPRLNLKPIGESQHTAVKVAKNMVGATTRRQRLKASTRDMFGRQMGEDEKTIQRGMYGERKD